MTMRTLVSGGAGFIGSHLCERLLAAGHEVICLDNFSTGRKDNVVHLLKNPRFALVQQDIVEPCAVEVDRIYNLASPASPPHYQADPVKTVSTNVIGAFNVLELARATGARVLQASTSEVYGDPEVHPQPETYWGHVNCIGPRACYDEGKRVAETLFFEYHRRRGVDIRLARIFNTYGPRMRPDDGRVVSNFVAQALAGEPLTIYGDGSQTRSFCYIDDMVDGLVRLMESTVPAVPVNLGNPEEFTIRELAVRIVSLTGSDAGLTERALPADDPKQRRPDISRARQLLGWEPRVRLDEGLGHTLAFFRELRARQERRMHVA